MGVLSWGRAVRKRKAVDGSRTCYCCQPTRTHDPDHKASQSGGKKSAHEVPLLWGLVHDAVQIYMWGYAVFLCLLSI